MSPRIKRRLSNADIEFLYSMQHKIGGALGTYHDDRQRDRSASLREILEPLHNDMINFMGRIDPIGEKC